MSQQKPPNVQFVIIDDEELDAEAHLGGRKIGYVWNMRTGDRLQLCDIHVDERCRGSGVGGGLLGFVLAAATAAGIREVWGLVTNDDLKRSSGLVNWYAKNGFRVEPATDADREMLPTTVHRISCLLR